MRQRNPLRQTWRAFAALWHDLQSDGPFGVDFCEESAGALMTLHDRLRKAGVRFAPEFDEHMAELHRLCSWVTEQDFDGGWMDGASGTGNSVDDEDNHDAEFAPSFGIGT